MMKDPTAIWSFNGSISLMERVERARDRAAAGDMRKRPSRSRKIVMLLEKALEAEENASTDDKSAA